MDHAIYTALGGANAALHRQTVISHNLANANTHAFRAQLAAFRAIPILGAGDATRTQVVESTPQVDFTPGPLQHTGRMLDIGLPANGWLTVEMAPGAIAYTRNGHIQTDSEGQLHIAGLRLLSNGAPIVIPSQEHITLAPDGTISAQDPNGAGSVPTVVGRIDIIEATAGQLRRGDDGLFYRADNQPDTLPVGPHLQLIPETLEGSNVNAMDSAAQMIATARRFEMCMSVISGVEKNEKSANQLLAIS